MTMILPEEGAHWYTRRGEPAFTVPNKSKPGQERAVTARDAKALGLLPSVTGITRMLNRAGLQAWIVQQHVMAALTLPEVPGETADDRAKRVILDARAQVEKASNFGGRIHEAIERYLAGQPFMNNLVPSDIPFVMGVIQWLEEKKLEGWEVEELEYSFANERLGFGGRVDARIIIPPFGRCIVDWKTQQTVPGKPFRHYPEHGMQLAGYGHGTNEPDLYRANVLISSTEPGRIEPFVWFPGDLWAWQAFLACKVLYYAPVGPGKSLGKWADIKIDEEDN